MSYRCETCKKPFKDERLLRIHEYAVHGISEPKITYPRPRHNVEHLVAQAKSLAAEVGGMQNLEALIKEGVFE